MIKTFCIKPYLGFDCVQFGMTPDQVAIELGKPDFQEIGVLDELSEYRWHNDLVATFDNSSNVLVELGFGPTILDLEYEGLLFFRQPAKNVLKQLVDLDGAPYEDLGFVVLFSLGIALTGFHNNEKDELNDKAVTIFAPGRWDDLKDQLKPFKGKY